MTKPARVYADLLISSRRPVAFRDFERLLAAFGFTLDRTRGSHQQWVHPDVARPLPVQPSGKDAKRYQVRQFLDMVEEFGLRMEP